MKRILPIRIRGWTTPALSLLVALLAWSALPASGGQVAVQAAGQGAQLQQLNLATFDTAWSLINERYWDPEFGGLDWPGVRDELRPRAADAVDREELREVLNEMISRLGQSHFGVIAGSRVDWPAGGEAWRRADGTGPGDESSAEGDGDGSGGEDLESEKAADLEEDSDSCSSELEEQLLAVADGERSFQEAGPGFDVILVGEDLLVSRVDPGGPADLAGVRAGWQLLSIDDQPLGQVGPCLGAGLDERAKRHLAYEIVQQLLGGDRATGIDVELADAQGVERAVELRRSTPSDAQTVRFGNLPPMQFRFHQRWIEAAGADKRIGLIRFNVWMMPVAEAFERAILEMQTADGIVLDLRGNPGGVAGLSAGIAGYFVESRDSLGVLKYRRDELHLRINPRLVTRDGKPFTPYAGPLAILLDQFSASTSEIFAAGLQDLGRVHVFGETSAAAALPAVIERLPNGDFLMHALADLLRPNGGRVEGIGVVPDEEVQPTQQGLLEGKDEVLARAVQWLAEQARTTTDA